MSYRPRYIHLEFRSITLAYLPNGTGPSGARAGFLDTAHTVSGRHCCLCHVTSFDAAIGLDDGCYRPNLQPTNGYHFFLKLYYFGEDGSQDMVRLYWDNNSIWRTYSHPNLETFALKEPHPSFTRFVLESLVLS